MAGVLAVTTASAEPVEEPVDEPVAEDEPVEEPNPSTGSVERALTAKNHRNISQ